MIEFSIGMRLLPAALVVLVIALGHRAFFPPVAVWQQAGQEIGRELRLSLPAPAEAAQHRQQRGADEGPGVLYLSLITAAAIGTAALLGLLFHFIRVGIGFTPHRPPERREEPEEHSSSGPEH